ncbi:e9imm peptide [Kitasatospora sp. NPDC088134]|uniref:e9imm peptide n=1 Tax=Kitasatospora sp. NPDC088134 TaxID=3364071 RepID=UPI0037FC7554
MRPETPERPETPGAGGTIPSTERRAELVELVRRILDGDPEADHCLRLFQANVTHPRAADLIFHPPAHLLDAPAERIVEEALRYRPIAL